MSISGTAPTVFVHGGGGTPVNSYPILTKANPIKHARVALEGGGAALGTR
jgi:hypothetical protein